MCICKNKRTTEISTDEVVGTVRCISETVNNQYICPSAPPRRLSAPGLGPTLLVALALAPRPRTVHPPYPRPRSGSTSDGCDSPLSLPLQERPKPVAYTHLRAHETKANLVCRPLLDKKKILSHQSSCRHYFTVFFLTRADSFTIEFEQSTVFNFDVLTSIVV